MDLNFYTNIKCDGCGKAGNASVGPVREYADGGFYDDHCAEALGVDEAKMI